MNAVGRFFHSLKFAFRGLLRVARSEQNFRLELLAATAVIAAMFLLELSWVERAVLFLAIALVLVLELMNSIFERMVDLLKPRIHHYVEEIKDVMAGSVLVAAIASVVIGVLIFWPHLGKFIGR